MQPGIGHNDSVSWQRSPKRREKGACRRRGNSLDDRFKDQGPRRHPAETFLPPFDFVGLPSFFQGIGRPSNRSKQTSKHDFDRSVDCQARRVIGAEDFPAGVDMDEPVRWKFQLEIPRAGVSELASKSQDAIRFSDHLVQIVYRPPVQIEAESQCVIFRKNTASRGRGEDGRSDRLRKPVAPFLRHSPHLDPPREADGGPRTEVSPLPPGAIRPESAYRFFLMKNSPPGSWERMKGLPWTIGAGRGRARRRRQDRTPPLPFGGSGPPLVWYRLPSREDRRLPLDQVPGTHTFYRIFRPAGRRYEEAPPNRATPLRAPSMRK